MQGLGAKDPHGAVIRGRFPSQLLENWSALTNTLCSDSINTLSAALLSIMGYHFLREKRGGGGSPECKCVFCRSLHVWPIHLRHPGTLLFRGEIKLQSNIDCSFMISHLVDQSNPPSVINSAAVICHSTSPGRNRVTLIRTPPPFCCLPKLP